jgi:hypothetical protein
MTCSLAWGADTIQQTGTTAEVVQLPSEDGLKESPKRVRQKEIDRYIKNLCFTLVIVQLNTMFLTFQEYFMGQN